MEQLQFERGEHLDHLFGIAPFPAAVRETGNLHGNGAAAAHYFTGLNVVPQSPGN